MSMQAIPVADEPTDPRMSGIRRDRLKSAMSGQNIICFAKDFHENPTSNNHVMAMLARNNRVLWLNSVATRPPDLSRSRDIGKIAAKLKEAARGVQQVSEGLWVHTPLVLPFPHSAAAQRVNRWLLRRTVDALRHQLGMKDFQLWFFIPTTADYVGLLGESGAVYYCVDEWAAIPGMDPVRTATAEAELCRRVDVVFCTSQLLVDGKRGFNPNTHLAAHGVDQEHFARAFDESTEVPDDIAALPGPVLGFFGTLEGWVDKELIAFLARRHPDWSIVLIGKPFVDMAPLDQHANVHILGRRPYETLPGYCRGFSVGLIPYQIREREKFLNPIKLREYLSAGLPVISTAIPELVAHPELCDTADSHEAFAQAVERALASDSPDERRARSEAMRAETWERKVTAVASRVMAASAEREEPSSAAAPQPVTG